MFHFSDDEISSILSSKANDCGTYFSTVATRFRKEYKPLFFTPYHSVKEFGQEFVAPIMDPIRLAGMSAAAGVASFFVAAACLGGLLIAGTAALFMNTKFRDQAFDFSCKSLLILGSALVTAASCFLLALASIPHSLFSLFSRSITSLTPKLEKEKNYLSELELTSYNTSCS